MVNEWHTLGFVIRQGDQYLEVDRCDTTFITLLTPHVDFRDVAQGPMGMSRQATMAIAFEVRSPGAAVTLEVQPGDGPAHPRLTLNPASDVTPATQGNEIATATLGVHYETGPAGEVVSDQVTVTHVESNRTWTVTITASTVGRRPAAAALVLDRSGSMAEDRGDGQSKHEALKEAASLFVDLMLDGDAVALVRHDDEAHVLRGLTPLDPAALVDPKLTLKNLIAGPELAPSGPTSIGDGIFAARQVLNGAGREYGVKALVVLTDGIENRPRWISEVAPEINERTYAVGLGTPDNTSVPMLQAIAGNHGGYMLVTGPVTGDNRFVLQKYFLQILAGINQADVVLDPDGALVAGPEQEIPFTLTEADTGVDVVLLTPDPEAVDFRLQTPNGFVIEPWRAKDETSMRWVSSTGMACYRLVLPAEIVPARYDQAGTWRILLSVGKPKLSAPEAHAPTVEVAHVDVSGIRLEEVLRRVPPSRAPDLSALAPDRALSSVAVPGGGSPIPYSVGVYAYSDVSLQASITQSGFEPGGAAGIEAVLTEAGKPNGFDASVWAEVTRPDGSQATVALKPTEKGRFTGSFPTPISGVYKCRVRASGRSRHGYPFQRETTLTAVVWLGGDRQPDPADVALRKCLAAQCDPGKEKEPGKKVVGKIGPEKALDEAEKIKDEAEKIKDEAEKIKDEAEKIKDEAKKYRDEAKKHRDEAKKHRDEAKREKPVQPMDEAPKPDVTDAQPVPDE
jgi:Mg-chelatase subunit ChlD